MKLRKEYDMTTSVRKKTKFWTKRGTDSSNGNSH